MAKINEIDITSLTFQEGSAPTTPASTKWKIYTKTDGLYVIDDAGSETGPLGTGGGGAGSKSYITDPGLKPPDSAHADDDEFLDANGTDPTSGSWSWVNQDSVTAEVNGTRVKFDPTSSSARGVHGIVKAFPGTGDVTISCRMTTSSITANHGVVLFFMTGTIATPTAFECIKLAHDRRVYWFRPGVTNRANYVGRADTIYAQMKFVSSGTTTQARWAPTNSFGHDDDWIPLAAASNVTSGSRYDYYGIGVVDETSASSNELNLGWHDFFRVNWTPDFDPTSDI